ncbi:hypothetical protein RHMOL_Rhmol02G0119100 [Rhododendron molle]|uniref:Uncharacterized protein n=1 Tax=Rhododendron molle TaxID=49168 RepID=A0ACC0PRU7_RHOML|nr:hypothetical protein RHMOL_Rhmol02G0119100 [Rhododendron molle]
MLFINRNKRPFSLKLSFIHLILSDAALRLRPLHIQTEEEAALGRGKHQRKAVSYGEAYAPQLGETLNKIGHVALTVICYVCHAFKPSVKLDWETYEMLNSVSREHYLPPEKLDRLFALSLKLLTEKWEVHKGISITLQAQQMRALPLINGLPYIKAIPNNEIAGVSLIVFLVEKAKMRLEKWDDIVTQPLLKDSIDAGEAGNGASH